MTNEHETDQDGRDDQPGDRPAEDATADDTMTAQDLPLPSPDFLTFAATLGTQALVHLGAVPDPMTGKTSVHLAGAKYTIDLLDMIEKKTAGNRTDDETRHLEGLLYELRMRYVECANTGA